MQINKAGYFWLDSWVMGNVIQLATQDFCRRFLDRCLVVGGVLIMNV